MATATGSVAIDVKATPVADIGADVTGGDSPLEVNFDAAGSTDSDGTLEDILPFYVRRMPYWQRLHASAMSRSLRGTVTLAGQRDVKCRHWQSLLPKFDVSLLAHDG